MIFADTGYFVALADPADGLHAKALAWTAALREKLVTTEFVLVETVNLLSDPDERAVAHRLLRAVEGHPDYTVVPADTRLYRRGLLLHSRRSDKSWSLTDCISFGVMEQYGVRRALAHDRHFEQAGFGPLLRRDPA